MKPIALSINILAVNILDHLTTAVIVFDEALCVQYLNQVAESLLAVSARHVLQQQLASHISCAGQSLNQLITQASDGQATGKRGVTLITNDHTEITVDCLLNRVVDENNPPYTIVELQQVDRQLRITRENQLISQQAATRDLIRGLAHEIKNPLGGLRGAAQLLAGELDPELHEYTHIIIQEADRLQALVNRMLGPNRRPEYKAVNIHQVLERVRSIVLADFGDKLQIERDYDPSIPELIGDLDQLIQAVLNIVANAARALDGNGRICQRTRIVRNFTIGQQCHRLIAQIDIEDNGPGISSEITDTLFLPMVTSGNGIGLGLSIAQSLITQHKGLVECRSKPGQTIFTILLPLPTPADKHA